MTQLQLPAYLQNNSRSVATAALAGLNQGAPPSISIRQNRFRLIDAGGLEKLVETFHLDVVIADANPHISKVYYREAFDPTATDYKPPTCFSDNGSAPSAQAMEPQCATCAACPQNIWGSSTSRVTGKQTKACNDVKKLACLVPGLGGEIAFLLRVPPASLKNLSSYVAGLNAQVTGGRRVDVTDVVTRITFDDQTQGVLNFKAVNWIDEATFHKLEELGPSPFPRLTGASDQPRQAALPGPVNPTSAPAAAKQEETHDLVSFQQPSGQSFPATQTQPAGFAPGASPSEPAKRHRRTKAEMEAARAAEASQSAPANGFGGLQGSQQGQQTLPPTQGAQSSQPQFGIVSHAPEPDKALSEAISNAFNLPM